MWNSFKKRFECTAGIISFFIGIIAIICLWPIHPVFAVLFGGGLSLALMGEKLIFWPKSVEEKVKDYSVPRKQE